MFTCESPGMAVPDQRGSAIAEATQTTTWLIPAPPRPRILPVMSGSGGTEEMTISTARFSFSSVTDWSR